MQEIYRTTFELVYICCSSQLAALVHYLFKGQTVLIHSFCMEIDMLILTRRASETLMIGDDVMVTVLGVKGNQVRIGIEAPKDVAVHREEIYERIKLEKNAEDMFP